METTKLTRAMLLARLRELRGLSEGIEAAHYDADNLLLDFIDDDEVRKAFENVPRWYA